MATISTSPLSKRVTQMEESATIKMAQMARELKAEGHDVISLSLGEPDFDTPVHIKEAAKEALDAGYTKYTPVPGLKELQEAICLKLKRDNEIHCTPNQIVVSNGAKQSFANICLAMLDEGDEVIVFAPYWVSYYEIIRLGGGTPVVISAGIEEDFKVNAQQLKEAITDKTKFIIFSSPCNPTGSVYSKEELEEIATVVAQHENLLIVADEIYEYINFTGKHASIGAIEKVKDQTVTINGFSKGFSMTGWRLGYMAAPQWLAAACAKIQGQFTSGAASFSQKAATHALLADMTPSREMCAAFERRRQLVIDGLKEIPGFKVNFPQGAFYVFPDISAYFGTSHGEWKVENADDFCAYILQSAHVAVVTGSAFGADNCFRISYAAADEVLVEAIKRIKEAVSKLK